MRIVLILTFIVSIVICLLNVFQYIIFYTNFTIEKHIFVDLPLINLIVIVVTFIIFFCLMNKYHIVYFREIQKRYFKYFIVILISLLINYVKLFLRDKLENQRSFYDMMILCDHI